MKKMNYCLLCLLLIITCVKPTQPGKINWSEQWLGVYLKDSKIGYNYYQIQALNNDYKIHNRMKIKLTMLGEAEEVLSDFSGIVDMAFYLKSFSFNLQSKARRFQATGKIHDNRLEIEVTSGGKVNKIIKNLKKPVYPIMLVGQVILNKQLATNKSYYLTVFDPTILDTISVQVTNLGKEEISLNNQNLKLMKIELMLHGLKNLIWLNDDGKVYKEISPPNLVSIAESKEQALSSAGLNERLDILNLFAIRIDTIITNPRQLKKLSVVLEQIEPSGLNLEDDFQKIVQTEPLTIEIKKLESIPTVYLPISSHNEYLKPSPYIQSNHPDIRRTAQEIVKQEKNATLASQKIMEWVYHKINKRPTASLPSALDVLENLEGDCNEHAILYAALCRAIGIPCQICVGLVYVDNFFYYHAWNKVYLDKWISVDATFNQFPADATHIKFAEGELAEQATVLKIADKLKIRVIGFE